MSGSVMSDHEVLLASSAGEYIGDGYFNPTSQFREVARFLDVGFDGPLNFDLDALDRPTYVLVESFEMLRGKLMQEEVLFGLYSNGSYELAPNIWNVVRLLDFESRVSSGALLRIGFYGVLTSNANRGMATPFDPDHSRKSPVD
jgi:hypothetical protein